MKNFEYWLQNVEQVIAHLSLNADWSVTEIEKRLHEHKRMFQSDIESHAKIINSVLKLSNKLKQSCADCTHFYDTGLYLQNRWHCLWLKSLEWQCRLEQELSRKKKVSRSIPINTVIRFLKRLRILSNLIPFFLANIGKFL